MVMFAGIATQISSLTWKTIGFIIYIYSGADYLFFRNFIFKLYLFSRLHGFCKYSSYFIDKAINKLT